MSWKSRCGKTNVRIIYVAGTTFQGTLEDIYNLCPINKFSGGGRVNGKK